MAKAQTFDEMIEAHRRTLEQAPEGFAGQRALGLPWWIPEWLVAQAISTGLAALRAIAKTDAAKAKMKKGFLLLFEGIKSTFADDPDFNCD